ncbi:ankyrin repeat-containing domain protein, partial [Thelonectria olida]
YWPGYGDPTPEIRKTSFPGVTSIVRMLLDANADVAVVDKHGFTALDVALQKGCPEAAEALGADDKLFALATEKLERDERTARQAAQIRQYMRTQIMLMQPRSSLDILGQDQVIFHHILEKPWLYLELLTCEDAAKMINQGFKAIQGFDNNLENESYYAVLAELMKPGHSLLVERVPDLVRHYSDHISLEVMRKKEKELQNSGKLSPCFTEPFTALQLACKSEEPNMQTVQVLVEKLHVRVNEPPALRPPHFSFLTGKALHLLAEADNWWQLEAMRYLLANGADVNARNEDGQTPLHIAARGVLFDVCRLKGYWRHAAVRILLANGADITILDHLGNPPLHNSSGAPDIMRELLRNGADMAAGAESPLFSAIHDQNLAALKILLDHGLSVNTLFKGRHCRDLHWALKNERNVYALLCASFGGKLNTHVKNSVPLLRCLVERGADLYLPLSDTETLIHFLFEHADHEVLDALLQEPCASRIDFNRHDQRGRTVLMSACSWQEVLPGYRTGGHFYHSGTKPTGPPLRILDLGADATLVDDEGKSALHHLLDNPRVPDEVVAQFINREEVAPTLSTRSKDGFLPFHCALRTLRPGICDLLISKGASLFEPDPNGLTTLHHIATQWYQLSRPTTVGDDVRMEFELPGEYFDGCLGLWQRFLAEGGSVNAADNDGNTPLHEYLLSRDKLKRRGDSGVCHLDHYEKFFPPSSDVDVFAANHAGDTALHVIARRDKAHNRDSEHDKALFRAMMDKGLDPLKEDARGRSALDVASACDKDDIVGMLGRG